MDQLTNFYKHRCDQLQEQINHIELQLQEGFVDDMRRKAGNTITNLGRRLAGGAPVNPVVDPEIAIKKTARETHIGRTLEMLLPVFAFNKNTIPNTIAQHKANSENPLYYNRYDRPDTGIFGMPKTNKEWKQTYKADAAYEKSQAAKVVERGHNNILGHFASILQVSSQYAGQHPDNRPDVVIDPVYTGHGFAEPSLRKGSSTHFIDGFHPDSSRGRTSASHPDHEAYDRWQSRSQNAHHPTVESLFGPDSGTYHVGEEFEHLLPAGGGKSGIRAVNAANRERYRARMQQINTLMNPQDIPDQWRVAGRMG